MHGGDIYNNIIKYDFSININPLGCGVKIKNAIRSAISRVNQYPDLENRRLKNLLLKKFGNLKNTEIVLGNGASELLSAIVRAFDVKKALLIVPCFSGYENALSSVNSEAYFLNLNKANQYEITEEKILELQEKLIQIKPDLLIITNPNNPNGKIIKLEIVKEIADICRFTKTNLLIDESFIELTDFAENSFIYNLPEYSHVIILRSFTKTFAIPGIRLGYCVSCSDYSKKIQKQLPEWNVSVIAEEAGIASCSYAETERLKKALKLINNERLFLMKNLLVFGFDVFESDTNFLLFYCKKDIDLKYELLKLKILIRDCSDYRNLSKGFYRIAVKTHKENCILIKAFHRIWSEKCLE